MMAFLRRPSKRKGSLTLRTQADRPLVVLGTQLIYDPARMPEASREDGSPGLDSALCRLGFTRVSPPSTQLRSVSVWTSPRFQAQLQPDIILGNIVIINLINRKPFDGNTGGGIAIMAPVLQLGFEL
jgi:hypothetical protein